MSDPTKTYYRTRKKKKVDESQNVSDPSEPPAASSGPNVRPRVPKRIAASPIVEFEEEVNNTTSEDDDDSNESYRIEIREGKGPATDDDDEDEDADDNDDEIDDEDIGGRERGEQSARGIDGGDEPMALEIRRPANPGSHKLVNYLGNVMTDVARKKRREWPYGEPKSASDFRFHTFFQ